MDQKQLRQLYDACLSQKLESMPILIDGRFYCFCPQFQFDPFGKFHCFCSNFASLDAKFESYIAQLKKTSFEIQNEVSGEKKIVNLFSRSRYNPEYRHQLAQDLYHRRRQFQSNYSALLTLTYRDADWSWAQVGADIREFLNRVKTCQKKICKSTGSNFGNLEYFWSLEPHKTGKPHIHIVFSGARPALPFMEKFHGMKWTKKTFSHCENLLRKQWSRGFVKFRYHKSEKSLQYSLKYLFFAKNKSGEDMWPPQVLAQLRHFRTRMRGNSRNFFEKKPPKSNSWRRISRIITGFATVSQETADKKTNPDKFAALPAPESYPLSKFHKYFGAIDKVDDGNDWKWSKPFPFKKVLPKNFAKIFKE